MMRVLDCGKSIIVLSSPTGGGCPITKVDQDHYLDASGNLCEFDHADTKGGCVQSVRRAFGRMKAIISCNYERPEQVALLTLTYAENMQDYKQVRPDLKFFFRKLKRISFPDFEYLYVKETQARGAWHVHLIMFFAQDAPGLRVRYFDSIWGHGRTDYRVIDGSVNNVGQYLSSCLTQHGPQDKKASRLQNYPPGMKLYCCSRGIKRPVELDLSDSELDSFLSDRDASWQSTREWSVMISPDQEIFMRKSLYIC